MTAVEQRIKELQLAPIGSILFTSFTFENYNAIESLLDKLKIEWIKTISGCSITYRKSK